MKYDLNKFYELEKEGYVRIVESPCKKLISIKYTDACTYEKNWTDLTRVARGIILEKETGLVVAKPLEKFFNIGEMPETFVSNLPKENYDYVVTEKYDGSCILIYWYDGEWKTNTLGSFNSDQSIKAKELLEKYDLRYIPKWNTLICEIIYPENKIVVNYNKEEKLVLLSVINSALEQDYGVEMNRMTVEEYADVMQMEVAKSYNYTILEMIELQKTLPKDSEGFVIHYPSYMRGLRVKIKGDEYCRVHKMISNMTPLAFWESMEDGIVRKDYIAQLPEEFRIEAESMSGCLEADYAYVRSTIIMDDMSLLFTNKIDLNDKRQLGMFVQSKDNGLKHPKAMFPYITQNHQALNKYILNYIKPVGNVFKDIINEL